MHTNLQRRKSMPSIRPVAVGAVLFSLAAGGAAAQTAMTFAPAQPLSLSQPAHKAEPAKPKWHAKRFAKTAAKPPIAAARGDPQAAPVAAVGIWPDPQAEAASLPAPDSQPQLAPAWIAPTKLVIEGRTVAIVPADEINEIDLGAGATKTLAATQSDTAGAAPDEPRQVAVAQAQPLTGSARNLSWMAQLAAMIGGAVAAGFVAWFLLAPVPEAWSE
jgi:hypothetical protein